MKSEWDSGLGLPLLEPECVKEWPFGGDYDRGDAFVSPNSLGREIYKKYETGDIPTSNRYSIRVIHVLMIHEY